MNVNVQMADLTKTRKLTKKCGNRARRLVRILLFMVFTFIQQKTMGKEVAGFKTFDFISAEDGQIDYQIETDSASGWYSELDNSHRFHIAYKQADRDSGHPSEVASAIVTRSEHFSGNSSIALSISSFRERNPRSTAFYKVSISNISNVLLKEFRSIHDNTEVIHKFSMKIDGDGFSLSPNQDVGFEQFWQGSPFHPPVSLRMMSEEDALQRGWGEHSRFGHFALCLINDDHGPSGAQSGNPQLYDLGVISVGRWISWEIRVLPSPVLESGFVSVYRDNNEIITLKDIKVGYNRDNPIYKEKKPSNTIQSVEIMLYRENGSSYQKVFFDDMSVSTKSRILSNIPR